jgi:hypothetical protein
VSVNSQYYRVPRLELLEFVKPNARATAYKMHVVWLATSALQHGPAGLASPGTLGSRDRP